MPCDSHPRCLHQLGLEQAEARSGSYLKHHLVPTLGVNCQELEPGLCDYSRPAMNVESSLVTAVSDVHVCTVWLHTNLFGCL